MRMNLRATVAVAALLATGGLAVAQGAPDKTDRNASPTATATQKPSAESAKHPDAARTDSTRGESAQTGRDTRSANKPDVETKPRSAAQENGPDAKGAAASAQENSGRDRRVNTGANEKGETPGAHANASTRGPNSTNKSSASSEEKSGATSGSKESSQKDSSSRSTSSGQMNAGPNHASSQNAKGANSENAPRQAERNSSRDENASSNTTTDKGRVTLSADKEKRVIDTIRKDHVENINKVDFDVRVGSVVPDHYHYHTLPSTLVEYFPRYRGYDYLVAEDTIIIIDPHSHRIVDTVEEDRSSAMNVPNDCR